LGEDGLEKEKDSGSELGLFDLIAIGLSMEIDYEKGTRNDLWTFGKNPHQRIFEWVGRNLKRSIDEGEENDGKNVLVALANVYLGTSGVQSFIDFLKQSDLAEEVGRFNTEAFCEKVRKWNERHLLVKSIEALNKTENKEK